MRYRRLNYRYAVLLATGQAGLPGHDLRVGRLNVVMAQPRWRPSADVYETASAIHLTVELAGVEPEELDVLLYEDAVIVDGRRRLPMPDAGGVYHAAEIRQGPFRLELPLPALIDLEQVEARYENGLLQMTFVKVSGR